MPSYATAAVPRKGAEGSVVSLRSGGSAARRGVAAEPAPIIVTSDGAYEYDYDYRPGEYAAAAAGGGYIEVVDEHRSVESYGEEAPIVLVDDVEPVSHRLEPSILSAERFMDREPYGAGSPGSRVSRGSRGTIERIVSMPFPNAKSNVPVAEITRPDQRNDIIIELRKSVSNLEGKIRMLEGERANLKRANQRAHEENQALKREIALLTRQLGEEKALVKINLAEEEMRRREAWDLVDLQRKLLVVKEEEIRQLAQVAAALKEQVFILYAHMGSPEVNCILDDNFDPRRVDTATLDPATRQRVEEIVKAMSLDMHFNTSVQRKLNAGQAPKPIFVGNRSTAYALDAADGVLDGQFHGATIMVPKPTAKGQGSASRRSVTTAPAPGVRRWVK